MEEPDHTISLFICIIQQNNCVEKADMNWNQTLAGKKKSNVWIHTNSRNEKYTPFGDYTEVEIM